MNLSHEDQTLLINYFSDPEFLDACPEGYGLPLKVFLQSSKLLVIECENGFVEFDTELMLAVIKKQIH